MPNKTLIATSEYRFQTWVDREGVPNHIPNEQIAKYRALIKERKCAEGKEKKKLQGIAQEINCKIESLEGKLVFYFSRFYFIFS